MNRTGSIISDIALAKVDGAQLVAVGIAEIAEVPAAPGAGRAFVRCAEFHGEMSAIRSLVFEGFRVPLGEPDPDGNLVDIAHSTRFVLVDGAGGIRGYYDSDAEGVDEVFSRARHVLRERRR